jgi:hypothetical protein
MAKRTRYPNRTARRPGSKRPGRPAGPASPAPQRPAAAAPAGPQSEDGRELEELPARTSSRLTDAEIARAEAIQAELVAKERAAIAESIRRRTRARGGETISEDVNAPLSVRAAHEYAYVARDVRHIIMTGGLMVALLAILYVAIEVLGVITL